MTERDGQDHSPIVYNEPFLENHMNERMSESDFQQKAEQTIVELEHAFGELAEERDIDVQIQGGVLTVSFDEGEPGKFIVSPNSSVRQVWVSARMASYKLDWSDDARTFALAATSETATQLMTRLTRAQLADDTIEL